MRVTIRTSPLEMDIPEVGNAIPISSITMMNELAHITLADGTVVRLFGDQFVMDVMLPEGRCQ